jgi:hypothetical protein
MIINQPYKCIFARFFKDRSVVKFGMTRDFDSRIVGSSPTAPLATGSKSMVDGWFWEPAARGSNPLSPITPPFGVPGVQIPPCPVVWGGSLMAGYLTFYQGVSVRLRVALVTEPVV